MNVSHSHKYARIEAERRFLVTAVPSNLDLSSYTHIQDTYISGTRLRLRLMTAPDGTILARKLGQKYLLDQDNLLATVMTNLYLNEAEYHRMALLPGQILSKRRYTIHHEGIRFSLDIFEGNLASLILCEVERVGDMALEHVALPPFATREVTHDPFFTGGQLVQLTAKAFQWHMENEGE